MLIDGDEPLFLPIFLIRVAEEQIDGLYDSISDVADFIIQEIIS